MRLVLRHQRFDRRRRIEFFSIDAEDSPERTPTSGWAFIFDGVDFVGFAHGRCLSPGRCEAAESSIIENGLGTSRVPAALSIERIRLIAKLQSKTSNGRPCELDVRP